MRILEIRAMHGGFVAAYDNEEGEELAVRWKQGRPYSQRYTRRITDGTSEPPTVFPTKEAAMKAAIAFFATQSSSLYKLGREIADNRSKLNAGTPVETPTQPTALSPID